MRCAENSSGSRRFSSIARLDGLASKIEYLPLTTAAMRIAAELWAQGRQSGQPTADPKELDGDVILAAQALLLGARCGCGDNECRASVALCQCKVLAGRVTRCDQENKMTLILELEPEVETRLRRKAERAGQSLPEYSLQWPMPNRKKPKRSFGRLGV